MAGILSRLFGGGSSDGGAAKAGEPVSYQGLVIRPAPVSAGGQWRLAGTIVKEDPAGDLEREFTRADTFASRDEAESFTVRKAKQIIDEQGDKLFASGEPSGRA